MARSVLQQQLENLDELPIIPETLNRVLHELEDPTTSASTLEYIVREDPSLTAQLLKLANSPYYGAPRKVSSVAKAIVLVGFEEVRNLVIGLCLTKAFPSNVEVKGIRLRDLWLHSIGTALASQMLAEKVPQIDSDEMFTAGMVHDVGCAVMHYCFPEKLTAILESIADGSGSYLEAEEKYGITHTEVGAYLAATWGFSDMLINVIRYHHTPQGAGPNEKAAAIVFLADALTHKVGLGWAMDHADSRVLVPKILKLNGEIVKQVALTLKHKKQVIIDSWGDLLMTG